MLWTASTEEDSPQPRQRPHHLVVTQFLHRQRDHHLGVCIPAMHSLCDGNQWPRSSTSPGTVYLMGVRSYLQNGPRDAAAGCRLDFSLEPRSWRGPTLEAHIIHRSRFNMSWATPWLISPAEFNPAVVKGRVELRISTSTPPSSRVVLSCASSTSASVRAATLP